MLATSYRWTDSRTLMIQVRRNVQFQNGAPFDAAAVKYAMERNLHASCSFRSSEIGAMVRRAP
jgi:ABC-type transport system substrate-binding protein